MAGEPGVNAPVRDAKPLRDLLRPKAVNVT